MNLSRRSLITGLIAFAATAPAIVRASSLMPVKVMEPGFVVAGVDFGRLENCVVSIQYHDKYFWVTSDEPQVIHWATEKVAKIIMEHTSKTPNPLWP